mgnify:CR=1 FL=1
MPIFVGTAFISLVFSPRAPARRPLVWGYGMLLGLLATPLVMRTLDVLGVPITFYPVALSLAALILVTAIPHKLRKRAVTEERICSPDYYSLPIAEKALFMFFLSLIVLRFATVGLELLWRPLFPWDATMHWATKARVWFDTQSLVPFVENGQWLEMGGAGVFTDNHPGYPITTPLLQTWVSLSIGRWDESLINVPWLLCCIGLLAAFYGQARVAGSSVVTAMVFTYMLVSMPLLGTHVALAGYADLFLGACYCAAIMAFHNWSLTGERGQAIMAILFALFCPLIKNEGLFWLLTFTPGLIVVLLPARRALTLLAAGIVMLAGVLLLVPQDLAVAGHSLGDLDLRYRAGSLAGIATSIWVQDNWHLLGYLLVALPPLVFLTRKATGAKLAGIATILLSAIVLFLLLFLVTRYSLGAVRFTAVGRISLHLVPALMFFCLLLWNEVSARTPFARTAESAEKITAIQS